MKYKIPCPSCGGKGGYSTYLGDDIIDCKACDCKGFDEVTKEEYERFWTIFSKEDFQ